MADRLIDRFGSLGKVLTTSPGALREVIGSAPLAWMLSSARDAVIEGMSEQVQRTTFDQRDPNFRQYLNARFASLRFERLDAFFLDEQHRYFSNEVIATGELGGISGSFRKLFTSALDVRAAGMVLVHNHPSGRCTPSAEDRRFTTKAARYAAMVEIDLVDHLIVAGGQIYSIAYDRVL